MRRFKFSLSQLLKIRKLFENQRKQEFGIEQSELFQRYQRLDQIDIDKWAADESWKKSLDSGKIQSSQVGYFENFKIEQDLRTEDQKSHIDDQTHVAYEAFRRWKESKTKVEILERVKNKRQKSFKKDEERRAQKEIDDLVVMNFPSKRGKRR